MIKLTDNSEGNFRLLNLTDTQLTAGEWEEGNPTGMSFRETTETLIERVSPNLITISGDLSYAGDFVSYKKYADYMDSFKIPWTCCFGNHDNQDGDEPVRQVVDEYMKHKYFVFEKCEPSLGNSNFVILIEKNGKSSEGVILMDTHDQVPYRLNLSGQNRAWAGLTKEQLDWYEKRIEELEKAGCHDSTVILHIPIHAYFEAAKAAFRTDGPDKSMTIEDGDSAEYWNKGYEDSFGVYHEVLSGYPEDEGALALMSRLGNTKNVICGHDHMNNWAVKFKGVRLIFALKTGLGSYHELALNGGTVFEIDENGVKSVRHEYVDISKYL